MSETNNKKLSVKAIQELPGPQRVLEFHKRAVDFANGDDAFKQDYSSPLLPHLSILSTTTPTTPSSPAVVVWSFTVQPAHCNGNRTLHGGCIATLFDYCTTMPVMLVSSVADGFWSRMGVTRTLNMTYLRPIPVGTEIRIVCEVLAVGKRLGAIRGEMRRASDDALLVTCEHGRVNTDPPPKKGNKL